MKFTKSDVLILIILALALCTLLISQCGCVEIAQAPVAAKGNMACSYQGKLIFQGNISLQGSYAEISDTSFFVGEWHLCGDGPPPVECWLQIDEPDGGK